jgi:hypothetical protein
VDSSNLGCHDLLFQLVSVATATPLRYPFLANSSANQVAIQKHTLLIYTHGAGRLGNQLLNHAHLLAFCLEHAPRFSLLNIAVRSYRRYLPALADQFDDVPITPLSVLAKATALAALVPWASARYHLMVRTLRLLYAAGRLTGAAEAISAVDVSGYGPVGSREVGSLDLGTATSLALLSCAPAVLLCGWHLRSWSLLEKHAREVRARMALSVRDPERLQNTMREARANSDMLIGVHIRQGDYARWHGGRYLFSTEQYVQWMRATAERFGRGKRIGFLVCSDQPQISEAFTGLPVTLAAGHSDDAAVGDMIGLSQCDLLMMPPTTFGCWASFMGCVPILPLRSPTADISREPILEKGVLAAARDPDLAQAIN